MAHGTGARPGKGYKPNHIVGSKAHGGFGLHTTGSKKYNGPRGKRLGIIGALIATPIIKRANHANVFEHAVLSSAAKRSAKKGVRIKKTVIPKSAK